MALELYQFDITLARELERLFMNYLPNIIGSLIILVVGWVIGRLLGSAVGRVVARTGADTAFRRASVGRAILRAGFTASDFSRTTTKWVIYILAILLALENLRISFITASIESFLAYLPNIITAFIIFIIGSILSDWVGESIKKSFTVETSQEQYLNIFGETVKVILYFITITIALSHLGIDITIIYIIATAFSWAVAISVGVAAGIIVGWLLKDRIKEVLREKK